MTDMCVCVACGPPWRDKRPRPADDAPLLDRMTWGSWMSRCPRCGNKRCDGAADHRNKCGGRNL